MAPQPQLGLLPQRGIGNNPADHLDPGDAGAPVSNLSPADFRKQAAGNVFQRLSLWEFLPSRCNTATHQLLFDLRQLVATAETTP